MRRNKILSLIGGLALSLLSSCDSYLDVVPDNLATIEDAFSMRTNAEKYLFTCYSYMPRHADVQTNIGLLGGDEIWAYTRPESGGNFNFNHQVFEIARGLQTKLDPVGNYIWDSMYRAIRDCNIFLENIEMVPDMDELEKRQWISEVKFLKAYYYFYLIKHYGPVPLIADNLPIDASIEEVRVSRNPVNECFEYVINLLDDSVKNLPIQITDPLSNLGRITQTIALSLKAKILVYYASPLYNGNNDFTGLVNEDGTPLLPSVYDDQRWVRAAAACKTAIDVCEAQGFQLNIYQNAVRPLSQDILTELSIRNAFTEKWNTEVIWANTQSNATDIQRFASAFVNELNTDNTEIRHELGVPIKIAESFYTENGVPIEEDNSWDYNARFETKVATATDYPHIQINYETTNLHFNREVRYYANVGFDGGIWYGQGKYDEGDLFYIRTKLKQPNNGGSTGNYIKKYVHFENVQTPPKGYSVNAYPWPIIRLADLYLLYAEALNEVEGPSAPDVKLYLDKVRERAGLEGVDVSWATYSTNPNKPQSKDGLREIIQQERQIELAFEGQRYYDIRRWKTAPIVMNNNITGWDELKEFSEFYSKPRVIATQTFGIKDYFLPIKDSYILRNKNLVQNLGW
ncbi:RagB/SusD family nutrient uptake outer membrane protein [Wenyingzhuangia sp. IMCC45467]